jgi:hypothetical protein
MSQLNKINLKLISIFDNNGIFKLTDANPNTKLTTYDIWSLIRSENIQILLFFGSNIVHISKTSTIKL